MNMENKTAYEKKEKKYDSLNNESNNTFKPSPIDGSGSESLLKSISSQPNDITHSTPSSINPIGQLNNSSNNSNNINNSNIEKSQSGSKEQINKKKPSDSKEEILTNDLFNNNLDKMEIDNNNNNGYLYEKEFMKLPEEIKEEIKEKIKEGYIVFFLRAKGYKPYYFYGSPNVKFNKIVDHYIKRFNCPETIKNTFYYNNKLIDLNTRLKDLNIKPLSIISNEKIG